MAKRRSTATPPAKAGHEHAQLHLGLLGKLVVTCNRQDVLLVNRKCRALLGYLALSDGAEATRERLIGMLWSETDEERARASLRQALHQVRTALESAGLNGLSVTKATLALDRGVVTADVWQVLADAKEGRVHPRLLEAERPTDSLLAEFETIDPAFREWLLAKRQTLHDQLARYLRQALEADDGPATPDIARALLNLDPTDERAARTLMRLRASAGDIGGALATYRRLWDLLAEEFDVEPSKETQNLVVALKLAQPDSQAAPVHAEVSSAGDHDLVGIEGPATLTIFARSVSGEQAHALERLMTARPQASWKPLSEEAQKAWLVETSSAADAAELAFQLQSACNIMSGGGPRLLMGAHVASSGMSAGLHRALVEMGPPGQLVATQEFRDRLTDGLHATVQDLGFVQPPQADESVRAFTIAPPEDPSGSYVPESARLRPAIAVLPFELRAANDDSATLGELLADEVITALSKTRDLDVISRLSTRHMTQQQFGLCQVWSHLHSEYVLVGKPRSRGSGTELVIELTDARSKVVRWSQTRHVDASDSTWARELAEWIASEVMAAILVSESERATTKPLASLQSYTLLFAAITLMDRWTRTSFERSRELLMELHDRTPSHPLPNAWLSAWHVRSISQGWTSDPAADGRAAIEFAQRSLDSDPHYSLALAMDGWANVHAYKRLDIAVDRLSLAVESNPNDSLAWLLKGVTHAFCDEGETAAASTARALRLSPLDPRRSYYEAMAATSELAAGKYDRVIEFAKRSLRANRLHASTLRALAVAQWMSGQHSDARQTVSQLLTLEPSFNVSKYLENHPAMSSQFGRGAAHALQSAGVPS